ncbi:MAG: T9SS type A sorting domain-containing protein [Bacteroidales bacterium]|nr:T9SS type A sorting domain-containing protein [Bacteroidales bacterium]
MGTVTGGNSYLAGTNATITATANNGYQFNGWNDGVTSATRTVTVNTNAAYIANFSAINIPLPSSYIVMAVSDDTSMGTVTGSGSYAENASVTLTAIPNSGYQFEQWNDGCTTATRTVVANSDTAFAAQFSKIPNYYTVTLSIPRLQSNFGYVIGSGTYQEGTKVTIYAEAVSGYDFYGWSDGDVRKFREIVVDHNIRLSASFGKAITNYSIYLVSNNSSMGEITGGYDGVFPTGWNMTVTAVPYEGYQFDGWLDGPTEATRTITVTHDYSYFAIFSKIPDPEYAVTVSSNNISMGNVIGSGSYTEGTSVELAAVPFEGYRFVQWNDGNTSNPRMIVVDQDSMFSAQFTTAQIISTEPIMHEIIVTVDSNSLGEGIGSGRFENNAVLQIFALQKTNQPFRFWNDGNTDNPRTVTINSDTTFIAIFGQDAQYSITASVNPTNAGTVAGTGSYVQGTAVTLSATANTGYRFTNWNDGNMNATRSITVTGDAHYTANFVANSYTISVEASPAAGGSVNGAGTYTYGQTVTLNATANTGYHFTQWNDGNTNATRSINVTSNASYTAQFAPDSYTITANASPAAGGNVNGAGTYTYGQTVTLNATANTGYHFTQWNDGNTNATRSINVTSNASYTAQFAPDSYTITANASPAAGGNVNGAGTYYYGQNVTLTATANAGYHFTQWSDGNTDYTRTIVVENDLILTALFEQDANSCTITEFPYTDNFDSYTQITTTSTNVEPSCWTNVAGSSSATRPQVGYSSDGSRSTSNRYYLRFAQKNAYYAMPMVDTLLQNVRLTFKLMQPENNSSSPKTKLQVGVVSDPNDPSTFSLVTTIMSNSSSYAEYSVDFSSYTGAGKYICFHNTISTSSSTASYNYIDDIRLDYIEPVVVPTPTTYTVTVNTNNASMGTVSGSGSFEEGSSTSISATANTGYHFTNWSDGNTENPRTIVVDRDITLTAMFEQDAAPVTNYTVTVIVSNECSGMGTVTGSGTYPSGTNLTISATANSGFIFTRWNDNVTTPSRSITVNDDLTYIAYFELDSDDDNIIDFDNYPIGDGNSEPIVNGGSQVETSNGISSNNVIVYPNPTDGIINIQSSEEIIRIEAYDNTGRLVSSVDNMTGIDLSNQATGAYTIRVIMENSTEVRRVIKR